MLLKDNKAPKINGWGPHSRDQYPAKNATCHYCHIVGHLAKVCLSKLKKKDVRDIEATSIGASESIPDPSDHMFLGPISVTPLTSSVHAISCFPAPPYHIETNPDVSSVQHPPRQIPVQLQSAYREELLRLTQAGILVQIHDEYTPWGNSTQ